ncbi:MAG: helix-turn-helix transcriptional regulator [Clostridia bacterium]|nr:helix-turn-helix transcriptional regulator [Clostridia bacterium]
MKLKLAENLRKLRLEKGLTQEQLSEKMGVSYQAVSRWETGATYPDIEMLPALADLFDISLEKLMGVTKAEREEANQEYYDRLNRTLDHEERLKLLHEIHHEFPNDMTIVWSLCGETDDLEEQRKFTEELIERASDDENIRVYAEAAIRWLINKEDEDKLPPFLEKHTAPLALARELRLEERYMYRKEWDRYELEKQENLRKALCQIVFPRMVRNHPQETDINNSLWGSRTKLAVIDLLTGTAGQNPVSGDGVPDLWFHVRFDAGVRHSCHLASSGKPEEALSALEDLTELYEKFWSLPDQTVLTFRCPALDRIKGTIHHSMMRGPAAGPDYKDITHSARTIVYNTGELDSMWSHWMYKPLVFPNGWEWFDPIRNDPRYAACIRRMEAFITEGVWNPEG